jgi:hypothetical protein
LPDATSQVPVPSMVTTLPSTVTEHEMSMFCVHELLKQSSGT